MAEGSSVKADSQHYAVCDWCSITMKPYEDYYMDPVYDMSDEKAPLMKTEMKSGMES